MDLLTSGRLSGVTLLSSCHAGLSRHWLLSVTGLVSNGASSRNRRTTNGSTGSRSGVSVVASGVGDTGLGVGLSM